MMEAKSFQEEINVEGIFFTNAVTSGFKKSVTLVDVTTRFSYFQRCRWGDWGYVDCSYPHLVVTQKETRLKEAQSSTVK